MAKNKQNQLGKIRGIHVDIKKRLLSYIDDDNDITPKRMQIKLAYDLDSNKIKFLIELMPSLSQVIFYQFFYFCPIITFYLFSSHQLVYIYTNNIYFCSPLKNNKKSFSNNK